MAEITLRQLRYFATLSRVLQYRRAAQQLGISQPSLSLQISALEEAVGAPLLERKRNGLILTPAGRDVAVRALHILAEVDGLMHRPLSAHEGLSGTLRLGSSPSIAPYLMPRVLRKLHEIYPDFRLIIRDGPSKALIEDLLAGTHDLILTQAPVGHDDVRFYPLFREPLLLAVDHGNPLAQQTSARLEDLSALTFITLDPAYTLHRQIKDLSELSGAQLRQDFEGTSLDALRQMVALGMGVTLLPALYSRSEVERADSDVCTIPLAPPRMRQIGLAWRRSSGEPAAFLEMSQQISQVARAEFSGCVRF
ncbi:hydrogen peroxide-inducible genes activator [Donghicola tyrosinivorans]|uniref:LysR family hydrogen peroxide-inducible transcriptional activator n=1 Tax=Donghicola tyrosinivorans TaxID=1652492 RepID=A0A2T0WDC9_9RHOB|nr:hydrogen peroxide-inducible genes activator [Donghicola tyrosinivorans]PRY84707.1 LysR family hydrogen peroxide-inducible transcriptional activator [Donghicola tyrosinivorans]